jgi:hypothetical protein
MGTGQVVCLWERRCVYRVLVWTPEGKRLLGRPRLRWEDNSKMAHQELVRKWSESSWFRIEAGGGLL